MPEYSVATLATPRTPTRWGVRLLEAIRILGMEEKFRCFRPAEVELLLSDPSKAKEKLGREPQVRSGELVGMMVRADLQDQGREAYLRDGGHEVKRYHE